MFLRLPETIHEPLPGYHARRQISRTIDLNGWQGSCASLIPAGFPGFFFVYRGYHGRAHIMVVQSNARASRTGENEGETTTIVPVGIVLIPNTDRLIIGAKDVLTMGGAVHPPLKSLLRSVVGTTSAIDIFSDPCERIPLGGDSIGRSGAVRSGVRYKIIASHVCTMNTGRRSQWATQGKRIEPVVVTLLID